MSDLETQQKVSDSAVKAAMKSAAKGVLDKAVKAGTITQAQADSVLSRVGSGLDRFGHKPARPKTPGGSSCVRAALDSSVRAAFNSSVRAACNSSSARVIEGGSFEARP